MDDSKSTGIDSGRGSAPSQMQIKNHTLTWRPIVARNEIQAPTTTRLAVLVVLATFATLQRNEFEHEGYQVPYHEKWGGTAGRIAF